MNSQSDPTKFTSTEKVLRILLAFTPSNRPMGIIELSELLGIHRSSVSRILHSMKEFGFVQQDKKTKRYSLGRSVVEIANAVRKSYKSRLINLAVPHLMNLRNTIKESVAFEMLSGKSVFMAYRIVGLQPVTVSFDYGEMAAVNANAAAKVILAFSKKKLVDRVLGTKEVLPRYTKNTITDRKILQKQFDEIEREGFGIDYDEYTEGISAVAAPVFDEDGTCIAAVSILVPSIRANVVNSNHAVAMLKETVNKITESIAHGALPPLMADDE